MTFKKFEKNDVFINRIKTNPEIEFFFYDRAVYFQDDLSKLGSFIQKTGSQVISASGDNGDPGNGDPGNGDPIIFTSGAFQVDPSVSQDTSILIPHSPELDLTGSVLSFNIWVSSSTRSPQDYFVSKGIRDPGEDGYTLALEWSAGNLGRLWIEYSDNNSNNMGSTTYVEYNTNDLFVTGSWIMFTAVFDLTQPQQGDRISLYKNATLLSSPTVIGTIPSTFSGTMNNTQDLKIGGRAGFYHAITPLNDNLNFREFSWYKRVLTQQEITNLWNSGSASVPTNAEIYLPLAVSGSQLLNSGSLNLTASVVSGASHVNIPFP